MTTSGYTASVAAASLEFGAFAGALRNMIHATGLDCPCAVKCANVLRTVIVDGD